MDDKKNEAKTSRAEKVFNAITTIFAAVAAGFATCWGIQAYLPYGEVVNNLLPAISAIAASFAVSLVCGLIRGVVRSIKRTNVFANDVEAWDEALEKDEASFMEGLTLQKVLVSIILCPLCAGMGGLHAARMAGEATGVMRGLWIAGGSIVGWYATAAIFLVGALVIGVVWAFFATLFSKETSGITRCWMLVLVGLAIVTAGNVHAYELMRIIGLALIALNIVIIVIAAIKTKKQLEDEESSSAEALDDSEGIFEIPQTDSANGNRVPATNPDGSQAVCPRCRVKNMPQIDELDVQPQDLIRIKLGSWIDARKGIFPQFNGAIVDIDCVEANEYSGQGDGQQVRWLFKITLDETKEDIAAAITCFQRYAPFIARDCANLPDGEFYQDAGSWYLAFMGDEEPGVAEPILFASPIQSPVHQQEALEKELEWQGNLAEVLRESIATTMNRPLAGHHEMDGSDEFGYIEEWDTRHVKVAWYNYCEIDELADLLYPGNPWGPGQYGSSSVGQEGAMSPARLIDIKYIIVPVVESGTKIPADAIKGLADTLEHAEAISEWSEKRGQKMGYIEIR